MNVHICDYGSGNILSVERALEKIGADVRRCTRPDELTGVRALIIPGVGAFGSCIDALRERGFEEPIRRIAASDAWVLGICVGMQILATRSEEFGLHDGLDIIPGTVKRIPDLATDGEKLKRPHVGWSELRPAGLAWTDTPLRAIQDGAGVYFVHSFEFRPDRPEQVLACARYGGHAVVAAVGKGRIFGTQFHPEKSGRTGLSILREFVDMAALRQ